MRPQGRLRRRRSAAIDPVLPIAERRAQPGFSFSSWLKSGRFRLRFQRLWEGLVEGWESG